MARYRNRGNAPSASETSDPKERKRRAIHELGVSAHKLEAGHLSTVTATQSDPGDARKSTRPISVLGSDLVHKSIDHGRVWQRSQRDTTRMHRPWTRHSHKALNVTLNLLRLCLGRGNRLMNHKRTHHIAN